MSLNGVGMKELIDVKELIKSINRINADLIVANHLLREPAVIEDSVYDSLRTDSAAKTIDQAIKYLDAVYFGLIGIDQKRGIKRSAAHV